MGQKLPDDKWRNKYLDLLDEQDRSETRFQERLEILRRGLVQMSLELEGRDEPLDDLLAELRTMLREEEWPSLHRRFDLLTKKFESMDKAKQQSVEQFRERLSLWESELEKRPLSRDEMKSYRKWRKALKSRLQWEVERNQILGEVVALGARVMQFQRAPDEIQKDTGSGSRSFWDWLLTKPIAEDNKPSSASDSKPTAATETKSEKEPEAALLPGFGSKGTATAEAAGETAKGPDRVQQTLTAMTEAMCRLISRIHFDEELYMKSAALYNRLDSGIKLSELLPAFEEMVELIMAVVSTKQDAFQKFLGGLNQRLDALQNLMNDAGKTQGEFARESKELSESIKQQMQDIRERVMDKDTPFEAVKDTVLDKMDGLMGTMHEYLSKGQEREKRLSNQLDELNQHVNSLEEQADQAQKVLEEQRNQALIDPLTKVPNRQAYTQRLDQEYHRFRRYHNNLTLIILDVDHFKRINDTYGHLAGDKVLQLIARTVQKALRETDFIARFGGEEFVILLPEQTEEQGALVAEKVRSLVEACPFRFKDEPVTITVSLGGSGFKDGDKPEEVFERADKALYTCKRGGRNRWKFS